jgi:predicted lipoprotein with Yx(FWY)xxD motif
MNRIRLSILAALIATVVVVALATSGGSAQTTHRPAAAGTSAITVRQTSLGQSLVDANGRSLYLFAADKPNQSSLSAAGRAVWPPYTSTTKPSSAGGALASQVATTNTAAGRQITYNGHPLYYYVGDHKPGDTHGQGLNQFGARWYVVGPRGTAITSPAGSPAPAASSSGAYGY